ncbi:relaxase/mobilization nuclease domain-containing protein [Aeromicrobium sp.]|uniref:relaxase/mobilization nuclease domain-containing protein n=1 Tax=Aeromicrobium sp. TaxID=1871063 RepID=UPI0019A0D3CE|nr:relaxase/mobilization nuclease domain-containing protein [Aeromicrobium sp.]MBC7632976.1 relaxase/mobilization nuclease domain-containing protein [Aeromicrobium sp.]
MNYLAGPGRSNEHENPHLVGASEGIMSWYSTAELSRIQATELGRFLEAPNRQHGTAVRKAVKARTEDGGTVLTGERRDAHVWHCSLSLAPDHPAISDEAWGEIANEFVRAMDFVSIDEHGNEVKAPCRWVATHHGSSVNGGDHIHIAVNLVREDGTKASTSNDFKRASKACTEIELRHGLTVLESRQNGYGIKDLTRAELVKANKTSAEPDRLMLGRTVRAYATGSADEAEFVRRCRRGGVLVRPRYASDRTDVVVGYSVAARPPAGESPVWFGGGNLGRDLTLPRLRSGWPDTPEEHTAAVAEWNAAKRDQRPVAPGREVGEVDPALWDKCHAEISELHDRMVAVPVEDTAAWAQLAKETSGVFAAWSVQTEDQPGPLAEASTALSRFSQVQAHKVPVKQVPQPGLRDAALLLMQAGASPRSRASKALLVAQLRKTLKALYDYQQAAGQLQAANQVKATVGGQLKQVADRLPKVDPNARGVGAAGSQAADVFRAPGQLPQQPGAPVREPLRPGEPEPSSTTPAQKPGQGLGR